MALAVTAFFLWPRENDGSDQRPATTAIEPTPLAPEASAEDDSLLTAGLMSDAEIDSLTAALNASAGPDDLDTEVSGMPATDPVDAPAPTPSERATTPEASRRPAAAASAAAPRRAIQAPDVSGLPPALASSLAGTEAIQLGARAYTWVVTSVSSLEEADQLAARYRQAGFRARVIQSTPGGRTMYRVAIGQFDTQANALLVRERLPADVKARDDIWTLNLADL